MKHSMKKRIAAIIGIILLVALYLSTLICSFIHTELGRTLLMASVAGTIFIPVILYVYLFILRKIDKEKEKK